MIFQYFIMFTGAEGPGPGKVNTGAAGPGARTLFSTGEGENTGAEGPGTAPVYLFGTR